MTLLDFLLQRMWTQGENLLWRWIDLPPPSSHFAQENNTFRTVYSNGYGPWEREGVQRQLIASTATINKRVLWFSAELTNITQTRDATSKSSFIHPACTSTKLTYYANSKHSNKKKKIQCFCKHHLTTPYHTSQTHALLVSFPSKGMLQIPGCSQRSWMFYKAIAINKIIRLGSHLTSQALWLLGSITVLMRHTVN